MGRALAGPGLSLKEYAKELAEKATVAYEMENNKLVSCIIGYTHDTPDQGSYITQVATVESCRQRGIAQKLLSEYSVYAQQMGIRYIWLTTGTEDIAAQRLYEKCGFRKAGEVTNKVTGSTLYRYVHNF